MIYVEVGMPTTIRAFRSEARSEEQKEIYQNKIKRATELFKKPLEMPMPKCNIYYGIDKPLAFYWPGHFITVSEGIVRDWSPDELAAVLAHEISHAKETKIRGKSRDTRSHWQVDLESEELVGKKAVISCLGRLRTYNRNFCAKNWLVCVVFPVVALQQLFSWYELDQRIKKVEYLAAR